MTEKIFDPKVRVDPKLTGQYDSLIAFYDTPSNQTSVIDLGTGQVCYTVNQNVKLYAANGERFLIDHEIVAQVDGKWEQMTVIEKTSIQCALFVDGHLLLGMFDAPKL